MQGRRSPITGALVVADIVVKPTVAQGLSETIKDEILEACRQALAAHKVPVMLREVASLEVAGSGKLLRVRQ